MAAKRNKAENEREENMKMKMKEMSAKSAKAHRKHQRRSTASEMIISNNNVEMIISSYQCENQQ